MTSAAISSLEKMLAAGKDSALLRFSLGNEYLKAGDAAMAVAHLRHALQLDHSYSAAWKQLGQALTELGQTSEALKIYREGMGVAEARGDKQAAREMQVFARRLEKRAT